MVAVENAAARHYPIAALAIALRLVGALLPPPLFELYLAVGGSPRGRSASCSRCTRAR
jgi:hypothetical protein